MQTIWARSQAGRSLERLPGSLRRVPGRVTLPAAHMFRKYFLPGLVFQSLTIGGGYGTGRELIEFFLRYGPVGGLLAMALATSIWSIVCAVTFELARSTASFDYRSFSRQLLGPGWGLYELCYLAMMVLILAVIAASAGSILEELFGLPYYAGVLGVVASVGALVFKGSGAIERFLSVWSFVLYANFVVFLAWSLSVFGEDIWSQLAQGEAVSGWLVGGLKYGANNIGVVPAILFCVRHLETRREALSAGLLAGPLGILPGLLFYLSMVGQYPVVLEQIVPSNYILDILGSGAFQMTYQVVLLGTLIETGTAMIHAFNERIGSVLAEKGRVLPAYARAAVAAVLLLFTSLLARFGLVDLIARGYGTIAWGFLILFVIPVLTIGTYRVLARGERTTIGAG